MLLPGESEGQGSLVGYSPWDRKELDTTEQEQDDDVASSPAETEPGALAVKARSPNHWTPGNSLFFILVC